ncbi:hypothetical protein HZH68_002229 [Vespula germanica]|uniref:Uncharacterized protein n=1 Tax=Vespula germanica TaxID=30212 RepID=A0A834KXU4_VESGE|nr:hypothetical protein HZH68_002229 [Vespula germanica]
MKREGDREGREKEERLCLDTEQKKSIDVFQRITRKWYPHLNIYMYRASTTTSVLHSIRDYRVPSAFAEDHKEE